MPRINLLPWREQQRTDRKKAFGVGLGAAMFGALVLGGLAWLFFGQMIDAQQARNTLLRDEIKTLDKKIEEINNLETQKQQMIARMQIIEKLQQSRPEIVHVFDTFTKTIPDGVYLTSIKQAEEKFTIEGQAQSWNRIAAFNKAMAESEWLKDPDLNLIEGSKTNAFIVNAIQRTSAADAAEAAKATDKRKKP